MNNLETLHVSEEFQTINEFNALIRESLLFPNTAPLTFKQHQHVAVFGPPLTGKTTLVKRLVENSNTIEPEVKKVFGRSTTREITTYMHSIEPSTAVYKIGEKKYDMTDISPQVPLDKGEYIVIKLPFREEFRDLIITEVCMILSDLSITTNKLKA